MTAQPDLALDALNAELSRATAAEVIAHMLRLHGRKLALVSSFGAEAAVLLHLVSRVDPAVPVIMLDTQLLFPETLAYQTHLVELLGLADLRRISPDESADPDRSLHQRDTERCCDLRKTQPLERALQGFDAVITGRKRFQTRARADLRLVEPGPDGRLRVNPLADWSAQQLSAYMDAHALPRHPLIARGYRSIGCAPCTTPVRPGEDPRAGRWRGEDREECGIHIAADGTITRRTG